MSDRKLVSPLLDGFQMGAPISEHNGVRCCPAMRENSDDKYIVKIISIPSSQSQLDALLLTGAYPDAASAMDYFKELADGVVKEAEILKELSQLQGFLPYEGWQVVPMQNNDLGYEIYLLSPYKRSLESYLNGHTMTHLGAVNLGLDLCAALSICRRAGYLFVDLKPSNIFLTGNREYRIGDLGFASLSSLKFHALPSKYRSPYSPHELHDDLATLNPTADIYAVGMILYQIYNNGRLPFEEKAPSAALPAPLNADYEMAEIIQKAIDPSPRKRWQTPIEMGQALVSYMQRNRVNDVPIVPPALEKDHADAPLSDVEESLEEQPQTHEELAFLSTMTTDETAPSTESGDDLTIGEMSDEVSDMLAQADEILARQLPDQVVVPEAPALVIPELEIPEAAELEKSVENADEIPEIETVMLHSDPENTVSTEAPAYSQSVYEEDDDDVFISSPKKSPKSKKTLLTALALTVLLALAAFGGYRFYNDYYLMPIDGFMIDGVQDSISVFVDTQYDETLFTVICTDSYGNTQTMPLVGGKAEFIGLNPGTMYKITLEVDGFHQLANYKPCSFTTSEQTRIVDFTAKTGTEDGSVILNFTIDGRETQDWMIEYTAEDEEPKSVSFTGHMVAVTGLSVGKTYTFNLVAPAEDLWIVGSQSLEYTASKIVVAQNLSITGCVDGVLTAQWSAPADSNVESWTVRCYSDSGYDETITTSSTSAEFRGIIADKAYTVEVTAAGMTQNARSYVTANAATIGNIHVEAPQDDYVLNVSWTYEGIAPQGGWLLMYAVDGSDHHAVIPCSEPAAVIEPRLPGVSYEFTVQAADGSTVFNGRSSYDSLDTESFKDLKVDAKETQASLCPTPDKENWTEEDVDDDAYTSRYAPGKKASILIYSKEHPEKSDKEFQVMYVIRNSEGHILLDLVNFETFTWDELWNDGSRYCCLDIPSIPGTPGKYTIEIYFNSRLLVEKPLNIVE